MKKFRLPKNWRIYAIAVVAAVGLYLLLTYLVVPRVESWVMAQIPGSTAMRQAVQSQFPEYKLSLNSSTTYGADNQKHQTLTIIMSGKSYLNQTQLTQAETTICSALGQDAHNYSNITLQDAVTHQYIVFYYSQSKSHTVTCS